MHLLALSVPSLFFTSPIPQNPLTAGAGAGDVGIGTTAPLHDVHVHLRGDSALVTLLVTPSVSGSQSEVRLAENQTASPLGKLHVVDAVGGDGSVRLPTSSISSTEMLNEMGIASRRETSTKTISSLVGGTPQVLSSRSINCQSSGYVVALGSIVLRSTDIAFNGGADALVSIGQDNPSGHNLSNSRSIGANALEGDSPIVVGTFSVSQGQHASTCWPTSTQARMQWRGSFG